MRRKKKKKKSFLNLFSVFAHFCGVYPCQNSAVARGRPTPRGALRGGGSLILHRLPHLPSTRVRPPSGGAPELLEAPLRRRGLAGVKCGVPGAPLRDPLCPAGKKGREEGGLSQVLCFWSLRCSRAMPAPSRWLRGCSGAPSRRGPAAGLPLHRGFCGGRGEAVLFCPVPLDGSLTSCGGTELFLIRAAGGRPQTHVTKGHGAEHPYPPPGGRRDIQPSLSGLPPPRRGSSSVSHSG